MFEVSRDGRRFLLSINADDDASGNLVIVQNFSAYGIERELGQGGMATVYLGHALRHDSSSSSHSDGP